MFSMIGASPRRRAQCRRQGLLAGIVAVLLCAVAACGSAGAPAGGAGTTSPAAAPSAYPQTLNSPFGRTTLAAAPQRVIALGVAERDTTLALGVVPVAVGGYGPIDPWFTAALGSTPAVENLDISDGIPFEKIAALKPDLIITGWGQEADYPLLAAIAPVLWQVSDSFSTDWRTQVTAIATALDRSAQGAALVADTEAAVRTTAAAHPTFAGRTFTWSTYDPGTVNTVDLPTAPVARFLGDLGLRPKPELQNPQSVYSREISLEQLGLIDADVIIIYPGSAEARAELETQPTFTGLKGVQAGGVVFLDDALANGLNSPTLLSIPFVLDRLTPMLDQATRSR